MDGRATMLTDDTKALWRQRWDEAQRDGAWQQIQSDKKRRREQARREILALVHGFLEGDVPLAKFRETFDSKSRGAWSSFGLGGMSGAMILNMWVKYLPTDDLTHRLRTLLRAPGDEGAARSLLGGSSSTWRSRSRKAPSRECRCSRTGARSS